MKSHLKKIGQGTTRLLLMVAILLVFLMCKVMFSQQSPNIVWIVCEDISPFLEVYGDSIAKTPNINALAQDAVVFTKAYTTSGVCAPSRSSIITGMHAISIGTQHMRTLSNSTIFMPEGLPSYSAVLPDNVKAFPEYLRARGYYTTNNYKEDYQFEVPVTVWDDSSPAASYEYRPKNVPFFSVFNLAVTHESKLMASPDSIFFDPNDMKLPPYYVDTETVRKDMAVLYTRIEQMDQAVGEIVDKLKKDQVYDDSYVIFFSDHGGCMPWTKREILERGTHIPLITKFPKNRFSGTKDDRLISAVDLAPTMLSIAGIKPPDHLQGTAFLGAYKSSEGRKYVFAARDRMANKYDRVRSVSDGDFRYVYNFMPELPKYQDLQYRKGIPTMKEILELYKEGNLDNPYLLDWFAGNKPSEELYHTKMDPNELLNIAEEPQYAAKKKELKETLFDWITKVGDLSSVGEKEMVFNNWWKNTKEPPKTSPPKIIGNKNGVTIECATKGASIGYRIVDQGDLLDAKSRRRAKSWDFGFTIDQEKTIELVDVHKPWKIYLGETISLEKGQTLIINAHRIGYLPNEVTFTY
ncbi:sulfatase family protein [Flagellimonas crocea]|uniref:sulfatase family protein n=2 Tax=Flagellimonas TaxID=444459 RepID=UPI00296F97D8|nr:sulfatase [Muricauda sp. DH64]